MAVEISSWADLDAIREDLTEDYVLMADLSADSDGYDTYAGRNANSGVGWLPIGELYDGLTGTLDGNGHIISDLCIITTGTKAGLFGCLEDDSSVTDLIIINAVIIGGPDTWCGTIAAFNYGTIEGCIVDAVIMSCNTAAGIACWSDSIYVNAVIRDCVTTGAITCERLLGGIISNNTKNCTVDGCESFMDITATDVSDDGMYAGGLVAYNWGDITNSAAHGDVSGHDFVGGLVGRNLGDPAKVENCCATGDVTGTGEYAGGLAGRNTFTISNCYSTGAVWGINYVGGLVGQLRTKYGASITSSYSTGAIWGVDDVGGLVGHRYDVQTNVTGSFWDTETSGTETSDGGTGKTTAEMTDIDTYTDLSTGGLGTQLAGTAAVGSPMTDVTLSDDLSGDLSTDDWICLRGGSPEVAEARKVATVTASPPSLTVTEAFTEAFSGADIYKVTGSAWSMVLLPAHDGTASPNVWFINEEEGEYPSLWHEFPDLTNDLTILPVTCYGTGLVTWAWWQDAVPVDAVRVFKCILTGDADGYDDLTLPMSSMQYRLYGDGRGYLSIVVPNVDTYSGEIADRINGTLKIYQGVQYSDGTQSFTEMIRSTVGNVRYDKGGRNSSLTITGGGSLDFPSHPELIKEITSVTGDFLTNDGDKKIRCLPVFGLYPGDVFLYGGTYYLATYISVMVGQTMAQMEITYTDEEVGTLYLLESNTNAGVEW